MLLSICIPTYNRCEKVLSLLHFLYEEIECVQNADDIEIIISDNCSTDKTEEKISEYLKEREFFFYHRNKENLGLIGNLKRLTELAHGDYIWFMGDDDCFHKGIVNAVYNKICDNNYGFVFINHCAYKKYIGDGTGFISAIGKTFVREDREVLLDIFKTSGTSLMFISANVYNTRVLKQLSIEGYDNLALPLYWSFACGAKGKIGIISDILIENHYGEVTWKDSSTKIFEEYVPRILLSLPSLGYNESRSKRVYYNYKYKRSFLYMYKRLFIYKMKCLFNNKK